MIGLADERHAHARPQPDALEVFQEARLVLELVGDALDDGCLPGPERSERARGARPDPGHRVAVRAGRRVAEHARYPLFHLRRERVLEALGLVVHLPPLVAEDVDEKALDEAMAADDGVRRGLTGRRQAHFVTVADRDEALPLEAVEHLRDRRRRHAEEFGDARGDDARALVGERVDDLQVLLDRGRADDC
jgi:hypothetical protein